MGESERSDPKSTNLKMGYSSEGRTFPSILIPQEGLECSLQQPVHLNLDCQRPSRELCDQCSMMEFVPPEHQSAQFPCHHIPLNTAGESIASLQRMEMETALNGSSVIGFAVFLRTRKAWLGNPEC